MVPSPTVSASGSAGGSPSGSAGGFTPHLAGLADDELVTILRSRPDVAAPPPATVDVLASRLRLPASTARAVDAIDLPTLLVLATATRCGADSGPVPLTAVAKRIGVTTRNAGFVAAVGRLRDAALVWGGPKAVRVTPVTAAAVESAPVVVPEPGEPTGAALESAWESVSDRARSMLGAVARARVPRGALSPDPDSPARAVVSELDSAGLVSVDDGAVVPRAHVLDRARHGARPTGSSLLDPPRWDGRTTGPPARDAAAGVAALDLLHRCDQVLSALEASPAASLKAGGVGVREVRRLARATGVPEAELPLLLEVLSAAGLVDCGDAEAAGVPLEDVWAPTEESDLWRARHPDRRWATLVAAWWALPRRPWMTGTETETGTVAVLSDALSSPAARSERQLAFRALSTLPAELDPTDGTVDEVLRRHRPVRFARSGATAARAALDEAAVLGLVVGSALTGPARQMVGAGEDDDESVRIPPTTVDDLAPLLAPSLPEPVDEVIVQADLTILAPGPLVPDLAEEFSLIAEVESTGAATTYRVTERSLRRALDSGRTAAGIAELLERTSVTPVPQSLSYLVDDVARRHGRLRVASAMSVLRCDDPALVAEVLASPVAERCAVRSVAPTVLVSQAGPADLVDALREEGYAPVVEDTSGAVVALAPRVARVHPTPSRRSPRAAVLPPTDVELRAAVAHLRSADRARAARGESGSRRTGEAAVAFLHEAARTGTAVAVEVVDATGRAGTRLLVPASVGAGRLEGVDPESAEPVAVALHRVVSVTTVERGR